jgi:hypothetical protein
MKMIWLLFFLTLLSPVNKNQGNDPPAGLMVEFIRKPAYVLITDSKPEFTWIVPEKAVRQTAYQIMLATSPEILERDEADLWNTNKRISSRSSEIEYSGGNLSDNTRYFWKVRIWDQNGDPSKWSDIQSFRTGILIDGGTAANVFLENKISPVLFVGTGSNRYFIDFGKDAFGTLALEADPPRRDTIIVHLGEKLSGTYTIDRNPGGTIRYHRLLLTVEPGRRSYEVNIPRDERNTGPSAVILPDSLGVITPFRYCELENCNIEPDPARIYQKAYWYFFDDTESSFESPDSILNNVWKICKYSMKATSFAGLYIDGDRERIPYEADAYINQLGHYYSDREYSIARRTNEYFIDHPTWPTEWILQTVLLFHNDLMFTGNMESLAKYYKALQYKTLYEIARPDGLISSKNVTDEVMLNLGFSNAKERIRDIVDWPPSQKDTGWQLATPEGERDGYDMTEVNTVVNAFHYRSLVLMAEMAGYLGKPVDSLLFISRAIKVRNSINEKLFDRGKGIYLDGENSHHSSLHANMMALAFDIVPEEYKKSVVEFIKSRGMACSVYGAQFLLEGLYKAGEQDYAFSLMTATHDRSWYNMIRTGSTITMEAWDMKYKPNSDWNHAWGAVPANIIPGYMWGVRPACPGFSKAIIKPQLSTLKNSSVVVPTIRGSISAEYRKTERLKEFTISIPGNMECDFIIDSVKYLTISVNGKNAGETTGIIRLGPGKSKIIMTYEKTH